MPHYDYQCASCGFASEVFQKISEAPLQECPKCHADRFERGIGGGSATLQFKGSGFYLTDYKDEKSCCHHQESCCQKKDD